MTYVEHLLLIKAIKQSTSVDQLDGIFYVIPWDVTKDTYVKDVWLALSNKMIEFEKGSSNDVS